MARKRPQADHRADTRGAALSGLPHVVADSPAYLSLTPFERAVLHEVLRRFNGYNNGQIGISYEEIGERLRGRNRSLPNNARIRDAIVRLHEHGLLVPGEDHYWKERVAREYRLTFISWGKAPPFRPATNEYLRWTPKEKISGDAGSPEKAKSGDAGSPEATCAGDAGSPDNHKNGSFALSGQGPPGDAGSLLIVSHRGDLQKGDGGPFDRDAAFVFRNVISGHWRGLRTAARRRSWAASHGMTDDTVKEYITGNPGALPLDKQAELVATIKAEKKAKRVAARISPASRARA